MANYLATDTDLTAVANAIRTKGGTSAQMAFPSGFVSAVQAIPTGGSNLDDVLQGTFVGVMSSNTITQLKAYAAASCAGITGLDLPNLARMSDNVFRACTGLLSVHLDNLVTVDGFGQFYQCSKITVAVLPKCDFGYGNGWGMFQSCQALIKADFGNGRVLDNLFSGCTNLTTLILRKSSVVSLGGTNVFNSTPFASGQAGGTIYIPKALYDHLGDGTALDYKAATNWSTVDGYGTITWAQIEGSQYESYYADGTPIT